MARIGDGPGRCVRHARFTDIDHETRGVGQMALITASRMGRTTKKCGPGGATNTVIPGLTPVKEGLTVHSMRRAGHRACLYPLDARGGR